MAVLGLESIQVPKESQLRPSLQMLFRDEVEEVFQNFQIFSDSCSPDYWESDGFCVTLYNSFDETFGVEADAWLLLTVCDYSFELLSVVLLNLERSGLVKAMQQPWEPACGSWFQSMSYLL